MNYRTAERALLGVLTGLAAKPWGGPVIACGSVALALLLRIALEGFGHFFYLPMVPAVVITALLSNRWSTALSIALSVALNLVLVPREDALDAAINATLFCVVSWCIAGVCWRQRAALRRAKALARSLAGRDAILKIIAESVPILTLNEEGRVRLLTPSAGALLGRPQIQAIGRPVTDFVPDFNTRALSENATAMDRAPPAVGHWTARSVDGRDIPVDIRMDLLPRDSDRDRAVLCLIDLTQTQAARERARELTAQLNHVWRLNSLGEMAATLAHELNQPLSAATVYLHASQSDMARAGPVGDSAGRTLELAKGQLLRAGAIIRRMRDLLATGARSLEHERVSSMIEDLASVLALITRDTNVAIEIDLETDDDRVMADRIQFQQAVTNLVRNAVDAVVGRPHAAVVIVGRSRRTAYELSVEDNGPGIPDDQIDSIFQPMMTTKSGGMGLGLSVTRSIVESHGGKLEVRRSDLGGAAFSFRLHREAELEQA